MSRIPDEVIEYYAELFLNQRIREQGVTFERFLLLPEAYLNRTHSSRRDSHLLACLVLGAAVVFPSCGNASDAEVTASRFIDHYYVKADLTGARRFTEGLAARKIEQEQALVQGATRGAGDRQREVTYRLFEKRNEGGRLLLVYDLNIKGQGVPTLSKRSLLSVEKIGGAWRIMNFHDFDS